VVAGGRRTCARRMRRRQREAEAEAAERGRDRETRAGQETGRRGINLLGQLSRIRLGRNVSDS